MKGLAIAGAGGAAGLEQARRAANISNEEHNDDEAEQIDINELMFDWN